MGFIQRRICCLKYAVCMVILLCTASFARDDAFVDVSFEVLFNESGLAGIRNHWMFDDEYSALAVERVDANGDGVADSKELLRLQETIVDSLVTANYNNYVLSGSHFLDARGISDFKVSVKSGRLVLDFTVLFSEPATTDYTMLVVVLSDTHSKFMMDVDTDAAKVEAPKNLNVEYFPDWLKGITMLKAFESNVRGLFLRYKKM